MRSLKEISQTLKRNRIESGYTQSELRFINGKTQQQVSRLKSAKEITLSNLIRALDAYDLEIKLVVQERCKTKLSNSKKLMKRMN